MPFEINTDAQIWRVRFYGEVTMEDLIKLASDASRLESASTHIPPRISDLTQITAFKVGYPEVTELARRRRAMNYLNHFKSAIVVTAPAQIGFARMFQTLQDNPSVHLEIFSNMDQAETWISTPLQLKSE